MYFRKRNVYGYMTVEASFIIPWVMFIIVWIIYLGFFEYDRCLLFQDNYILAVQTAGVIDEPSKQKEWLDGKKNGVYSNKYMGCSTVEASGNVSEKKIEITSRLKVIQPLTNHAGLIPDSGWDISDTICADNFSYSKRLRLFRSVGRIVGTEE